MQLAAQGKGTASGQESRSLQVTHQRHLSEAHQDSSREPDRLEALRRQLASFDVQIHELSGTQLAVTGPNFAGRVVPDARGAWLLLRQLRGGL